MRKLNLVSLLAEGKKQRWEPIIKEAFSFFDMTNSFLEPSLISTLLATKIDVLFLDSDHVEEFKLGYYRTFKDNDKNFIYILVKDERSPQDFEYYKNLVDNIVYLDDFKLTKWKVISILRRYWDTYALPTTIIYKGLIVDFNRRFVSLEGKEIKVTVKEFEVLKYLLENKNKYNSKRRIYKEVWEVDDYDSTRVVDQMLFKLKRKIGANYFSYSRTAGVKIK